MAISLALSALLLAACGGSSKSSTQASAHASTSGAASPAQSPQSIAKDRALGAAGLLRVADFPSGWVATPRKRKRKSHAGIQAEVASCLKVPVTQLSKHEPEEVESPRFRGPNGETVSNSVTVKPTADLAAKEFAVLAKPQTPSCLTQAFGKLLSQELNKRTAGRKLPSGFRIGSPAVTALPFATIGDQTVAYRLAIPITTPAGTLKSYFDIVAVRAGRADVSFSFSGTLKPVAAGAEHQLTLASVKRLQSAGGVAGKASSA